MREFFVSYTSSNRPHAEWIAWVLEEAGYTTLIQAWDIRGNFVLAMDDAMRDTKRTVAVLSSAYLSSDYAAVEWAAAARRDPRGQQDLLVVFRVEECQPTGWLAQIGYTDLVGLDEAKARESVLARVAPGRAKPVGPVPFPGVGTPAPRNVPAHPPYPASDGDLEWLQRVRVIARDWRATWSARVCDLEAAAKAARAAQRDPAARSSAEADAARWLARDAGRALSALPIYELDYANTYGLNIHPAVLGGSAIGLAEEAALAQSAAEVGEYSWENVARVLESTISLACFDLGALPRGFAADAQAPQARDLRAAGPLILLHSNDEVGRLMLLAPLRDATPLARLAAREQLRLEVLAARLNPAGALEVVATDVLHLYGWWDSATVPTHQRVHEQPPIAAGFIGHEADAPVVVVEADGGIGYFGPNASVTTMSIPKRPRHIVDAAVWAGADADPQHWRALLIGQDGECISVDEQCIVAEATLWDDPLFRSHSGSPPLWSWLGGVELGLLDGFDCALVWRVSLFQEHAICFVDPASLQPLRAPLLVERATGQIQGLALAGGRWLLATTIQCGGEPSSRLLVFDLAKHGPAAAQPIASDGVWRGDLYSPLVLAQSPSGFSSIQVKRDFDTPSSEPGQTLLRYDWPERRLMLLRAGNNLRTAFVAGSEMAPTIPSRGPRGPD
jgi:hypothetical protein